MTKQELELYMWDIELHRTFVTYGLQRLRRYSLSEANKRVWVSGMRLHAEKLLETLRALETMMEGQKTAV